ncbi:MAG: AbrB/MazE/SpoVT family DNA-binding domain-containing protein [Symploca sp. SIO1B1]|nr:AbrB/MazE/SpoVT family DNA-binding domain-containing protein [Symploca sp. SIO1B1]
MKIDIDGKITIPTDIQNQLGLQPGTEIQLEVVGNTLQIRKPQASSRGRQIIADLRGKATNRLTTNDIMQLTRED